MRLVLLTLLVTVSATTVTKPPPVHVYTYNFSDYTGSLDLSWYEADCPQMQSYASFYGSDSTTFTNSTSGTSVLQTVDSVWFYVEKYNKCNDTYFQSTYIYDLWVPEKSITSVNIGTKLYRGYLYKSTPSSVTQSSCSQCYEPEYDFYYFDCVETSSKNKMAEITVTLSSTNAYTSVGTSTYDYRTPTTRYRYQSYGMNRDHGVGSVSMKLGGSVFTIPKCSSACFCYGNIGNSTYGSIEVSK